MGGILLLQMNLKIDRVLPYPPSLAQPYIFTFLPSLQALLLYPPPPQQPKQEEPNKKKFTFKANNNAAPAVEEVFIFELARSAWRTQQTKGKFPTRREFPGVCCMGPCLMVYGGKQVSPPKEVNDLYCLNLSTWQWKKLFAMEAPTPYPNPQVFPINEENMMVITKQIWVFSAKGVNWELQKGDLPGGIWEKVGAFDISFELRCGARIEQQIVIFGWQGSIKAISFNLQTKAVSNVTIEGEIEGKCQSFQIVNTSEGKGLLIDGVYFGSFIYQENNVFFDKWTTSQQVAFDRIAIAQLDNRPVNYGISMKKELALIELIVEKQDSQYELSEPNTARQIEGDYMKSSLIQNKEIEASPLYRSPPRQDHKTPSFTKYLTPLLYAEWTKRRILESKGKLLEESIKRAEKMVLALCRYGSEEEKRAHINKVRKIRENLSQSFNRETYFRKQMEERPGQNQLRSYVIREKGEFRLNEEEIYEEDL